MSAFEVFISEGSDFRLKSIGSDFVLDMALRSSGIGIATSEPELELPPLPLSLPLEEDEEEEVVDDEEASWALTSGGNDESGGNGFNGKIGVGETYEGASDDDAPEEDDEEELPFRASGAGIGVILV